MEGVGESTVPMMVAADSQSDPRAGKLKRFSTDQQFMRRLFALSVVISAFISRVVLFTFLNGLRQGATITRNTFYCSCYFVVRTFLPSLDNYTRGSI